MPEGHFNAQCAIRNAQSRGTRVEMGKLCPPLLCAIDRSMFFLPSLKGNFPDRGDVREADKGAMAKP